MDIGILLIFRIGLLVLLWFFIIMAIRALRRDTNTEMPVAKRSAPRKGTPRVLRVIDGPMTGSTMDLANVQDITLGRQDADFVLGDDYSSGRHARIMRRGNDWFVEDLSSRNGTYVNGNRIDQPERITVNSDITIGRTTLRLEP